MDARAALNWTLKYRGISLAAFLVGFALAAVGLYLGLVDALTILLSEFPSGVDDAVDAANPLVTIAFSLLGLLVWQLGKSFALFATLPQATGRDATEELDTERVKSEVLEVLDERLSEMQDELERTRRSVDELAREGHAAEFDERDVVDASNGSSSRASSTESSSAGASRAGTDERSASPGSSTSESAATSASESASGSTASSSSSSSSASPSDGGRSNDPLE